MEEQLKKVRAAAQALNVLDAATRSRLLTLFADAIQARADLLLAANQRDLEAHAQQLAPAMLQRLKLDQHKLAGLIDGIRALAGMRDPLGRVLHREVLDDELILERVAVPLGVVGVIFESRPDVLPQLAALALRTGNALVLKGGREAGETLRAFMQVLGEISLFASELPRDWILLLETREAATQMLHFPLYIDLIVPRGSNALVKSIMQESEIPVLGHADGVCHIFVHRSADLRQATDVLVDAKTQYPAACNAVETVIFDRGLSDEGILRCALALKNAGVTLRGDADLRAFIPDLDLVGADEWSTEYGALTVSLKLVHDIDQAIEHIQRFGSHHTDAILAQEESAQNIFLRRVDSSSVMINCSTRFADGFRYGFGAEVGISTGKLHARGPVGIEGLLSYKYVLRGSGHIVRTYSGADARPFKHAAQRR